MTATSEFRLPDLGEGLTEAEISTWLVRVGDAIELNQILVEVETEKAVVALPSPHTGTVVELLAAPGQTVPVGTPIIRIADATGSTPATGDEAYVASTFEGSTADEGVQTSLSSEDHTDSRPQTDAGATDEQPTVLVGYGPPGTTGAGRRRRLDRPPSRRIRPRETAARRDATPGARRLAGELGIDLAELTIPDGKPLTTADIRSHVAARTPGPRDPEDQQHDQTASPDPRAGLSGGFQGARPDEAVAAEVRADIVGGYNHPSPDRASAPDAGAGSAGVQKFSPSGGVTTPGYRSAVAGGFRGSRPDRAVAVDGRSGVVGGGPPADRGGVADRVPDDPDDPGERRETRVPIAGIRRRTAERTLASYRTVPHVTEFVTVDVTATMDLLAMLRASPAFAGVRLTPLTLVARAVIVALGEHRGLNSSWDEAAGEIVTKHYVNLGVAVATSRGLVVPVVAGAHRLGLAELAGRVGALAEAGRRGTLAPAELRGGTFTITNIGVFGVDAGTPIIVGGEAAILAVGAIRKRPWVFGNTLAIRDVVTLALSFDHRLVDGEQGSRFLTAVGAMLDDPGTLLRGL